MKRTDSKYLSGESPAPLLQPRNLIFLFPFLNCAQKNRSGEEGCRWLAVRIFNCG